MALLAIGAGFGAWVVAAMLLGTAGAGLPSFAGRDLWPGRPERAGSGRGHDRPISRMK
jgi:hypothetical protein